MLMKSANPALNQKVFDQVRSFDQTQKMTIQGTVNKPISHWVWYF